MFGEVTKIRAAVIKDFTETEVFVIKCVNAFYKFREVGIPFLLLETCTVPLVLPIAERLGVAKVGAVSFLEADVVIANPFIGVSGEINRELNGSYVGEERFP